MWNRVQTHLRRRRWAWAGTLAVGLVAVDHVRQHDDWAAYNHRSVRVSNVVAGDRVELVDGTRVRLIGLCDPTAMATAYLAGRLVDRQVTLLLPTAGTRDAEGAVRAYVYDGTACVNVDLVSAGLAYADRRTGNPMAGLIEPAEADARHKHRGMWADLPVDRQPPWRQAWLRARRAG